MTARFPIALSAAILCLGAAAARGAERLPNVVVILADDFGYGSCGCYGAEAKLLETPNLDRLAREGRRFTDANTTSSVCSPTRYSVLTGRYCWRTSLTHEVLGTHSPLHIEPGRLNLASLLKKHGYQTAAVGKWHLGYGRADASPKWRTDYTAELTPGPLDIGFDFHFGVPANHGDITGVYVENRFVYGLRSGNIPAGLKLPGPAANDPSFQPRYTRDDTESKRADPIEIDAPRRVNDRVMDLLADKAVAFIDRQQAAAPFFLYFTPVAVHNPVTPSKATAGQSAAGPFGDWIAELDRAVGRILEALDRRGMTKDTLVVFTSDNGGVNEPQRGDTPQTAAINAGLAVNGPWRGGKHRIWEGGFRVPFLVRWPGKTPAGTVCDETISVADLLATVAAVAGETLPPAGAAAEDSFNVLPAFRAESYQRPLRPDIIVHSSDGVFALRRGPWKWIEGIPADDIRPGSRKARAAEHRAQLYNLAVDPAETRDVAAEHPEVVAELAALLARYRDGGYSRVLPPIKPKAEVVLPPPGPIAAEDPLDRLPGPPWVQVRGRWIARDGAVWGTQQGADPGPAALRSPLSMVDGDLFYDVVLPAAASHVLRVQCQSREHVLLIHVSNRRIAISRQPTAGSPAASPLLAETDARRVPGQWLPVRVCFRGAEVWVQAGDAAVRASHPWIAEPKIAFALLVNGEQVGFKNVRRTK